MLGEAGDKTVKLGGSHYAPIKKCPLHQPLVGAQPGDTICKQVLLAWQVDCRKLKITNRGPPKQLSESIHHTGVSGGPLVDHAVCCLIIRENNYLLARPRISPSPGCQEDRESFLEVDVHIGGSGKVGFPVSVQPVIVGNNARSLSAAVNFNSNSISLSTCIYGFTMELVEIATPPLDICLQIICKDNFVMRFSEHV